MSDATSWEVLDVAGLVTVQDRGRFGLAHLGVPRAGWLDPPAARLANRLVGNPDDAAVLEITACGIRLRSAEGSWVAVTGARCDVSVSGANRGHGRAEWVPGGGELALGPALDGVRTYLAVGGGIDVEPVLGSRSTDTLAWVGPPRVGAGMRLPVGQTRGVPEAVDVVRPSPTGPLRVLPGPRADWLANDPVGQVCAQTWHVDPHSNRVGLRLDGTPLEGRRDGELPSEGLVLGGIQVPPQGRPIVFLADHPATGGYPVVAVVHPDDVARCAQLRPGDPVRFRRA